VDEISKTAERNVGFRNDGTVEHRLIKVIPVPTNKVEASQIARFGFTAHLKLSDLQV